VVTSIASIFAQSVLYKLADILPDQGYIYYGLAFFLFLSNIFIIFGIKDVVKDKLKTQEDLAQSSSMMASGQPINPSSFTSKGAGESEH